MSEKRTSDANVEAVIAKHRQRAEVGLRKYGVTTERSDLAVAEWMQHLQEELMDASVYIEAVMNAATPTPPQPGEPHPEDTCEKCGGPNITWFVASPLWNKYARERYCIVCPLCFAKMAEDAGFVPTAWQLVPENPPEQPGETKFDKVTRLQHLNERELGRIWGSAARAEAQAIIEEDDKPSQAGETGGEVITEEWLRSVGFEPLYEHDSGLSIDCPDVELSLGYRGQWLIEGTELIEHPPQTRGDLRRLCSALGIKLTEPKAGGE